MCTICDKKKIDWNDRSFLARAFDHSDVRVMAGFGLIGGVILAVLLGAAIASPALRLGLAATGIGLVVRTWLDNTEGKDVFWHGIGATACLLAAATSAVLAILI